jgi:hypothetical protein
MKARIILLSFTSICLLGSISSVMAQNSSSNGINMKVAHSLKQSNTLPSFPYSQKYYVHGEVNYRINQFLEAGIFVGNDQLKALKFNYQENQLASYEEQSINVLHIGLNANFHFLPLFNLNNKMEKFDIYLTTKLGREFAKKPSEEYNFYINEKIRSQAGFGATYQITKKIGVYTEYIIDHRAAFRYGISLKF